jgi:hypothetical protein
MKRWMIDWDPPQVIRQPMVFGDRATADAACALIIARLPAGDLPRPIVVEVLAGVLDNMQADRS